MIIMYKQFRQDKSGKLHPLFVFPTDDVAIGEWLKAKEGMRNDKGGVKSKLGSLAYRPGWHLSEAPYAPHIGIKENGEIKYMHDDTVWAEVEVYDGINYTLDAKQAGVKNGKFNPRDAYLRKIPKDGYYWYNTNPNAYGNWMIADRIRVKRVLTDDEVEKICWTRFHIHGQPHRMSASESKGA